MSLRYYIISYSMDQTAADTSLWRTDIASPGHREWNLDLISYVTVSRQSRLQAELTKRRSTGRLILLTIIECRQNKSVRYCIFCTICLIFHSVLESAQPKLLASNLLRYFLFIATSVKNIFHTKKCWKK